MHAAAPVSVSYVAAIKVVTRRFSPHTPTRWGEALRDTLITAAWQGDYSSLDQILTVFLGFVTFVK